MTRIRRIQKALREGKTVEARWHIPGTMNNERTGPPITGARMQYSTPMVMVKGSWYPLSNYDLVMIDGVAY